MVRFLIVRGNMKIVYQKQRGDASSKWGVVKIFYQENFCRKIWQVGLAVNGSR